jgi:hypothetical protein
MRTFHRPKFPLPAIGAAVAAALALMLLLASASGAVQAQGGTGVIYVSISTGTDGPGCGSSLSMCRTIKYALETKASTGDTLLVFPGTYTETLMMEPGVVIWAVAGPEVTLIDGEGVRGPMVYAGGPATTATAAIHYFTIRDGRADYGGGVRVEQGASPVIRGCVIRGNVAGIDGGGIHIASSSPSIVDGTIYSNTARWGGGIEVLGGQSVIRGNALYSNTASLGGGIELLGASAIVDSNVIRHNSSTDRGGGVAVRGVCSPTISYNTFYSNTADRGGGLYMAAEAVPRITNNIVVGNAGRGIDVDQSSPVLDYNNVWGNSPTDYATGLSAGPHSISADPMFVEPAIGELQLGAGSPAIDVGAYAECPPTDIRAVPRPVDGDLDGVADCDMGAYEYCSCDARQSISCGQQVHGDTMGHMKTYDEYDCIGWLETGPEDMYEFRLATHNSRITATLSNLSMDLDVFLMRDCGTQSCFSFGNAKAIAADLQPGRYYISVDGFNGAEGSYSLTLECTEKRIFLPTILKGA